VSSLVGAHVRSVRRVGTGVHDFAGISGRRVLTGLPGAVVSG